MAFHQQQLLLCEHFQNTLQLNNMLLPSNNLIQTPQHCESPTLLNTTVVPEVINVSTNLSSPTNAFPSPLTSVTGAPLLFQYVEPPSLPQQKFISDTVSSQQYIVSKQPLHSYFVESSVVTPHSSSTIPFQQVINFYI